MFTNAIEHLGCRLKLGNSAEGSILAVVGTGMPEVIVPLVAIVGSIVLGQDIQVGQDIALGAIIGSPFMLSTFALFMMGLVIIFQKRKKLELNLDLNEIKRNYKYFLAAYLVAMLAGFLSGTVPKIPIVCFLLFLYGVYVFRTIGKSKKCFCESCLEELAFAKFFDGLNRSKDFCIFFQLIVSIVFLTLSVHFFVKEIIYFSGMLNISPLILSFIVTPFATELPECVNSIIWLKQNKDDLAMANVLGAVVFQTTILFSLGIILTPWNVDFGICLNIILGISVRGIVVELKT